MVTTSMPAAANASKAAGGARNVNSLPALVPRVVMAVSRLAIVRSAPLSSDVIGSRIVAGEVARRVASDPS